MAEIFPSLNGATYQLPLTARQVLAANMQDASTVEGAALNNTIGASTVAATVGMSFDPTMRNFVSSAVGSGAHYLNALGDGYLYGALSRVLYRASSETGTWTLVHDFGDAMDAITEIRDAGDGEVLVARGVDGVWRSTGWAANPVTATWSQVLVTTSVGAPQACPMRSFGFDVDETSGWAVVTVYSPATGDSTDSRYLWLSKDHGKTWAVIFDANTYAAGIIDPQYSHMHIAALDSYWSATTPRIWTVFHKTNRDPTYLSDPYRKVLYSDDAGVTWTVLTDNQPVAAISTPYGMVFSSDLDAVAVYVVERTPVASDMTWTLLYQARQAIDGQFGFGSCASRRSASGWVHIGFRSSVAGYPGFVVTTDGVHAQQTMIIQPNTGTDDIDLQAIVEYKGRLLASYLSSPGDGSWSQAGQDAPIRGVAPVSNGGFIGGVADNMGMASGLGAIAGVRAVSIGVNAISGLRSVSIGEGATANIDQAVSIGEASVVTASGGTSIGKAASAAGGVSVGKAATTTGNGTAIGETSSAIDESVAAGSFAVASGVQSSAFGRIAKATGDWSVAFGRGATASAQGSSAFGRAASAAYANASAFGSGATATAASQVAVGARHFEILKVASQANPAANSARVYVKDNGAGKMQLVARFPTGPDVVIVTEA